MARLGHLQAFVSWLDRRARGYEIECILGQTSLCEPENYFTSQTSDFANLITSVVRFIEAAYFTNSSSLLTIFSLHAVLISVEDLFDKLDGLNFDWQAYRCFLVGQNILV